MKQTVYLETSVIGALASRPSKLLDVLFMQQQTLRWWRERRHAFDLVIAETVLRQISAGDPSAARERLEFVQDVRVLPVQPEIESLAGQLILNCALPKKALADALHIASAAVGEVDFLLTWNCSHISNAQMRPRIQSTCPGVGIPAAGDLHTAGAAMKSAMTGNPILDEIRQFRDAFAKRCNYDLGRMVAELRADAAERARQQEKLKPSPRRAKRSRKHSATSGSAVKSPTRAPKKRKAA